MPHYYFDLHQGMEAADPEGREFPDLAAARDAAIRDIRSILAESVLQSGEINLQHAITVHDGDQQVLLEVRFAEAVRVT